MKEASLEYIQEESQRRGARPRVKAVIFPFELDYGLADRLGEFYRTEYGGQATLKMQAGYYTSGTWISPIMQTFSENMNCLIADWEDQAGYLDTRISLRYAHDYEGIASSDYHILSVGAEYALSRYFQIKVELTESIRAWTIDAPAETDNYTAFALDAYPESGYESYASPGEFPGILSGLQINAQMELPENEILNPGDIMVSMALDFADLRAGNNTLVLDNRQGQWLPNGTNFYLQTAAWFKKRLKLYQGIALPNGSVEWQLLYIGQIEKLAQMAHGWKLPHTARLESSDLIGQLLEHRIGVPAADGSRQPFLRGYWRAEAEAIGTTGPYGQMQKIGVGSAILHIVDEGDYRGVEDATYLVEAESTGEIGSATFKWSKDGGRSWEKIGLATIGPFDPVELENNLKIYWTGGIGNDFLATDRWEITAHAKVFHYLIPGGPFQTITDIDVDGDNNCPGLNYDIYTGEIDLMGAGGQVKARIVKDSISHPVDIVTDILAEVGLSQFIETRSFTQARSDTPAYNIGVCFEDISAGQAIQEIVKACLLDFWVDFGEIKLRAYLGE
jgi:hypothetical protein